MRADWTASGACGSGSTALPRGEMRRATGGGATTSTTTIYEGADEAEGDTPYENPFVPAVGARCRHRRPQEPSGARLRVEADRPDCSTMASKRPESGVWPSDLEGQA